MEEWKEIKDWKSYQASNLGEIKSLNYNRENKEKKLKLTLDKNGYLVVCLCKNKKAKKVLVHRIIAETFIPNPNSLPQVNHIDGNKTNNRVENLEWCTCQENIQHAWENGLEVVTNKLRESGRKNGKKQAKKVLQYDLQGNFIKEWESVTEAARQLKLSTGNISSCCRGEAYKKTGGYVWKYKN